MKKIDRLMLHNTRFPKGALLVVLPCLLAFCGGKGENGGGPGAGLPAGAGFGDKTVLQVEGRSYNNRDFKDYLESVHGMKAEGLTAEVMSRLFDHFIDDRLVIESAAKRGLKLTAEEKRDYWRSSGKQESAGASRPEDLPESEFEPLIIEKYMNDVATGVAASDEEIRAYYEAHKKEYLLPERVKVSQIVVPDEDKAVSILRRLRDSGEDDFRKVAATESVGPEAARGGVMGTFRAGELPAEMEKAILGLSEGQLSRVVESPYGFHIFRLDARYHPQLRPMGEVAVRIKADLLGRKVEEAMAAHLKSLKEMLSWKAHTENLFFNYRESEK